MKLKMSSLFEAILFLLKPGFLISTTLLFFKLKVRVISLALS